MSFAVVTFISESDDSVETISEVPITWLTENQDFCKWPRTNANIYICKNKPAADDWPLFPIRLECICESLSDAKKKISTMENSSSDEAQKGRGFRVRRPNIYFSPAECSQRIEKSKRVVDKNDRISPPPFKQLVQQDQVRSHTIPDEDIAQDIDGDGFTNQLINTFASTSTTANVLNSDIDVDSNVGTSTIMELTNTVINTAANKCNWCEQNYRHILNALSEQNILLRELTQRIGALEVPTKNIAITFNHKLPCQNLEEIISLEQRITDPEQYQLFCDYIRKIGGNGGKDFLIRFMKAVFTNTTGEMCSWTGAKTNFRLQELILMKAGYNTITELTSITQKDFEIFVKEWLRHCKQRRIREESKLEK